MTGTPKLVAFFITIVTLLAFFKDSIVLSFGKDDYRKSVQSAAESVVINHMDWAALRVGDPPYLMQEGIEESIREMMVQNNNLVAENMRIRMVSESTPAYVAISAETKIESATLSLLNQSIIQEEIPVRVLQIIESKYTTKNY